MYSTYMHTDLLKYIYTYKTYRRSVRVLAYKQSLLNYIRMYNTYTRNTSTVMTYVM